MNVLTHPRRKRACFDAARMLAAPRDCEGQAALQWHPMKAKPPRAAIRNGHAAGGGTVETSDHVMLEE